MVGYSPSNASYYLGLSVSGDEFWMGRSKENPTDLYKVIPNPVLYNKTYLPILREYTALKSSFVEDTWTVLKICTSI